VNTNPIPGFGSAIGAQLEAVRLNQDMLSFETALQTAQNNLDDMNEAQLKHATREFEAFFLNMMFREMRRSVGNEHSFMPQSNAERIFQEMLDEERSRSAANYGGIGLADMMFRQLSRANNSIPPSEV